MAEIPTSELRAILAAEKADALASVSSSKLTKERSDAMDYYMGDVTTDIPNEVGRSTVVSSDVADTIEGLMPSLMDILCGGDEVVKFSPVGPEDVQLAEQETDFVNHVFMDKNPGFLILYTFIKDALLQKLGVVKIWTEEDKEGSRETYYNQQMDQLAVMLQQNPNLQVIEHTENEDGSHDVTLESTKAYKCHKVEPVPPEEFGISRRAKSVRDATYCFHECPSRTVGDLIAQGYDEAQVNKLSTSNDSESDEALTRDTVEESTGQSADGMNKAGRLVTVTEHYIRMDYRQDGKMALYRVVTGGEDGEVLKRDGKPEIEQVDMAPFAVMTPIIQPHRLIGRSLADVAMPVQRIKTALMRGMLNNLYMHNAPRPVISQQGVTESTIDDVMVHRIGGPIRVKGDPAAAIQWQVVPDITGSIYPALEYMDNVRELSTGVTRQGQGVDANALQNQSATAANLQNTAAQARMKLIAKIFAETGIKDLFLLLHATIRRHGDQAETVRLRNQWVQVDPRQWKTRKDLTIDVGLGTGGKQQELANLMHVAEMQKELLMGGLTNLVTPQNLYNTSKELTRLIGKKDPDTFFSNPEGQPPPEPQVDPMVELKQQELQMKGQEAQMKAEMGQAELQMKAQLEQANDERKAQIEQVQAQADIATQDRKTQAELLLAEKKFELERELKMIDAQIKLKMHEADMEMKREQHNQGLQQAQMGMHAQSEAHEQKMVQAGAKPKPKPGEKKPRKRIKTPSGKYYEIEED
jgi:hypothetical protein